MNKKGIVLWGGLLLLLVGLIVFVNLPEKAQTKNGASGASVKEGAAQGEALPDFSVTRLDGGTFTLSECRGKTVVINVWATWCGPCVRELPAFERLYKERGSEVAFLALHADSVTEDVASYLTKNGYTLPAALADAKLLNQLGYASVVPQTVIVAPNGTVTYNRAGALTYEKLARLVEEADVLMNDEG